MSKKEEEIVAEIVVSLLLIIFGLSGTIIYGLSLFEINNELLDLSKYVLNISMIPLSIILVSSVIFLHLTGRAFLSSIFAWFYLLLIFDNLLLNLL